MARPKNRIRQRNLQGMVLTIVIALVTTAAINVVIDPYGTFRWVIISGMNRIKPYPDHDLKTIKADALHYVVPDALILGNSRVEVGFDPTYSAWHEAGYRSVYNAAIAGAGTQTAMNLLEHAARKKPPRLVVIGIDFFDFPIASDFQPVKPRSNDHSGLDNAIWKLRATLTMQALLDSATTLRRQYQKNPEQLTDLGYNPLLEYEEIAKADGYWVLFRQRAQENAINHGRKPKNLYLKGTRSSPSFDDIRRIVRWAVETNAELRLVIYPYHAQMLLMIDELDLWPLFEEWKRQIVRIIDEETRNRQSRIALIDFSGFSRFATESIPPKNDKKTSTYWYWEAGHFKKTLGDLMLSEVLLGRTVGHEHRFGTKIDSENIQCHILALRAEKEGFRESNPAMVAETKEIIAKGRLSAGRR